MRRDDTGSVIAAALRADAEEVNQGTSSYIAYTCRGCQRTTRHSLNCSDGYCDTCNGVTRVEEEDAARRREGRRQLHRDTALLLRRLGFAERAAWHEVEADR